MKCRSSCRTRSAQEEKCTAGVSFRCEAYQEKVSHVKTEEGGKGVPVAVLVLRSLKLTVGPHCAPATPAQEHSSSAEPEQLGKLCALMAEANDFKNPVQLVISMAGRGSS